MLYINNGGYDMGSGADTPFEDLVNSPLHYTKGSIEVIDFILDQQMGYMQGNVVKYVSRYKYKNGLEDLKKAEWYIKKLIEVQEDVERRSQTKQKTSY